jgi:archaellum biogenesis protein FlaJ (TadC family)
VTSSASPKFLSIYCTALRENMSDVRQWKPVVGMLVISFAFAIVNLLLKKMIDQGTNNMVIATYRLSSSAIFLAPIAYFWER